MKLEAGRLLRETMAQRDLVCFIGVYDVFSATVAAPYYDGLFISGFGFAASYYGLPDIGFIAWPDIVAFVQRLRTVLPRHHLMVDIDDGYGDPEVACHVVSLLEDLGASGVILEDQKRPRRCGHFQGKQVLELDQFLEKLTRVLQMRKDLVVVARTDAAGEEERLHRAAAFAEAGADAVLVDGLEDLELLRKLRHHVDCPLMFNQIAGGKSPRCRLSQLQDLGVSLVNYSTPCLFAAQAAIAAAMQSLREQDGLLPDTRSGAVGVSACTALLTANLARRDTASCLTSGWFAPESNGVFRSR
jgi:2-methylisocitrate lyase-like PEP mutase family enzyme